MKRLPAVQETRVQSLGWEDPLEKKMATHSSTLAWKIPWTEEPGRLQSHGVAKSQTQLNDFTFTFTRQDFPGGSDGKVSVYNVRDLGSIPGLGRFPGEGNGNPLQYSCLENLMDRGAWCRLLSMGSQRVRHD